MQRVTMVPAGHSPRRLDIFVSAQNAHVSRASAQRWIEGGLITVNGWRAKPARRIRPGDVIACHVAVREPPPVEPEPIPLEVLQEDPALLVVNKSPGLVMHPAPGHWTGTLLNALVHHRLYLALVAGRVRRGGLIDQALGCDTRDVALSNRTANVTGVRPNEELCRMARPK